MSNFNSSHCGMILISVSIAGNQRSTFYPWVLACWSPRKSSTGLEPALRPTAELLPGISYLPGDLPSQGWKSFNLVSFPPAQLESSINCQLSNLLSFRLTILSRHTKNLIHLLSSNLLGTIPMRCFMIPAPLKKNLIDLDRYWEHLAHIKTPSRWDPLSYKKKCKCELYTTFSSLEILSW